VSLRTQAEGTVRPPAERAGRSRDSRYRRGEQTFPATLVAEACRAGLTDIGENRAVGVGLSQEALSHLRGTW
jgi:hypothetical protein